MVELYPWTGDPRTLYGPPDDGLKAAVVASHLPGVRNEIRKVAEDIYVRASSAVARHNGTAEDWGTGLESLSVEISRGAFTDYYVHLVGVGPGGEDNVEAALYSIENGRRSYTNSRGQRIGAHQGFKFLARAAEGWG